MTEDSQGQDHLLSHAASLSILRFLYNIRAISLREMVMPLHPINNVAYFPDESRPDTRLTLSSNEALSSM
jgi:hypothetical protein